MFSFSHVLGGPLLAADLCGWRTVEGYLDCSTTDDGEPTGAFPRECACLGSCDGRKCGDNGCGVSCGSCDDSKACTVDSCGEEGVCAFDPAPRNGTDCDDEDACTSGETCQAGTCGMPTETVVCTAMDACHNAGGCSTITGVCSNPQRDNGSACEHESMCTAMATCQDGVCTPTETVNCPPQECREMGSCDAEAGCLSELSPDGSPCSGGVCREGVCVPEVDVGTDMDAGYDTDLGPDADAGPAVDIVVGAGEGADAEGDSDGLTDTHTSSDTDATTDAQTDTAADSPIDTNSGTDSHAEADENDSGGGNNAADTGLTASDQGRSSPPANNNNNSGPSDDGCGCATSPSQSNWLPAPLVLGFVVRGRLGRSRGARPRSRA